MKCPIDDSPLSVSSREGVEIDFCPQCRGVWLDRGELDKIIDRVASSTPAAPAADDRGSWDAPPRDDRPRSRDDDYYDDDRRHHGDSKHGRKRRKRGFLDDLFDFD